MVAFPSLLFMRMGGESPQAIPRGLGTPNLLQGATASPSVRPATRLAGRPAGRPSPTPISHRARPGPTSHRNQCPQGHTIMIFPTGATLSGTLRPHLNPAYTIQRMLPHVPSTSLPHPFITCRSFPTTPLTSTRVESWLPHLPLSFPHSSALPSLLTPHSSS